MAAADLAARLPEASTLKKWSQSLAVLDSILSPEWEERYFSFNANWSDDEQLASMRDGSGNEYSILFTPTDAFIRGFDHESPSSPFVNSPPGLPIELLDSIPGKVAHAILEEPAFTHGGTPLVTLLLWRGKDDQQWQFAATPSSHLKGVDSSPQLFEHLDGKPETYIAFADEYYEIQLDYASVENVLNHRPLTEQIVTSLNPDAVFVDVVEEAAEIQYGLT